MGWFTPAGSIGIELSTPVVYSGGMIQGCVIADIKKDIDATSCRISLQGQERAHVHWTTTRTTGSGDKQKTETVHHHVRSALRESS